MYLKLQDAINTHSCTYNSNYLAPGKITQPMFKYYECLLMAETKSFQLRPE
jgi:hypothetical protein